MKGRIFNLDTVIEDYNKVLDKKHRNTGRTTRLVDKYIQMLFSNMDKDGYDKWVIIKDHDDFFPDNMHLANRIRSRLLSEHGIESRITLGYGGLIMCIKK